MKGVLILLLLLGVLTAGARDRAQVREFRKEHPCPATQRVSGACPGFVVDHIIPLCAGGADDPSNMQWQERRESLEKDRTEWALCRWIRKATKDRKVYPDTYGDETSKGG